MTTPVDICNLALARLGDEATVSSIDPPEQSVQAMHCATFYPIALRQALDDEHAYSFATRRQILAPVTNDAVDDWLYCYALPSQLVNIICLSSAGQTVTDYSIEIDADGDKVVYANTTPIGLVYVSSDVSSAHFSPSFVAYFSALLAHHLAGPILKGDVGASAAIKMLELARTLRQTATERDSLSFRKKSTYVPAGIQARQ
jgi:hypothetical protein